MAGSLGARTRVHKCARACRQTGGQVGKQAGGQAGR